MLVVLVSQYAIPASVAHYMQSVHVLVSTDNRSINSPPAGLLTALSTSLPVAINMSYEFWTQVNSSSVARRRRRDTSSSTIYISELWSVIRNGAASLPLLSAIPLPTLLFSLAHNTCMLLHM